MIDPDTATPRIAGLDTNALLQRLGGDRDLFWQVLGRFARSRAAAAPGADGPEPLARLISADPPAAHLAVHELKGVLGTLGAAALFAQASAIDAVVRAAAVSGQPPQDAGLLAEAAAFENGVAALIAAITAALPAGMPAPAQPAPPGPATPATPPPVSPSPASPNRTALVALGEALARGRVLAAREHLDALRADPLPVANRDLLERLAALVGAYRLHEALALLESAVDV